jgi:hypothetical protein
MTAIKGLDHHSLADTESYSLSVCGYPGLHPAGYIIQPCFQSAKHLIEVRLGRTLSLGHPPS